MAAARRVHGAMMPRRAGGAPPELFFLKSPTRRFAIGQLQVGRVSASGKAAIEIDGVAGWSCR
jgi:hypothetical protein